MLGGSETLYSIKLQRDLRSTSGKQHSQILIVLSTVKHFTPLWEWGGRFPCVRVCLCIGRIVSVIVLLA